MKKFILCCTYILGLGTSLQHMQAQTQINKSEKVKESREEKMSGANGKTILEEVISVEIAGDYEKKTYEYAISLKTGDSVILVMETLKAVPGFQILEGDKVISGPEFLQTWKCGPFAQAHRYTVRVPLDLTTKKSLHFRIRLKHIQ